MILEKNILNGFDNQTLTYHKIIDCIVDQNSTNVSFIVGSWVNSDFQTDKPALKTSIDVHYDQWSSDYYNSGVETIMGHPDWTGTGPEKPNLSYIWNPITSNWIAPIAIPLDNLKIEKWREIKSSRNFMEFGGFVWNGNTFDSSQASIIKIGLQTQSALIAKLISTQFNILWTLSNNETIMLSGEDMIEVSKSLAIHINVCHARGNELRNQINAANSTLQLSQIVW